MHTRLSALAIFFWFFLLESSAAAIPVPPCNLAAHDASSGMLGAITLAEHIATHEGSLKAAPKKLARQVLIGELALAHTLAAQAMSDRKAAKDDASVNALGAIDQILIGLSKDLTSADAKKDPFHGVVGRIASLRVKTKSAVGRYEKNLDVKLLAILIGLCLKHGLVPATGTPASEQIVSSHWLLGDGGVASKLATKASKLPTAKSSAATFANARTGVLDGTSTLQTFESAHAALVGILIGL